MTDGLPPEEQDPSLSPPQEQASSTDGHATEQASEHTAGTQLDDVDQLRILAQMATTLGTTVERLGAESAQRRQLERESRIDPKTRLLNIRGLTEGIDSLQRDTDHVVVFVDIDAFKAVNFRIGHDPADDVLRTHVAPFLRSFRLRGGGIIARHGGDEFCMILPIAARDPQRDSSLTPEQVGEGVRKRVERAWETHVQASLAEPENPAYETDEDRRLRGLLQASLEVGFGLSIGASVAPANSGLDTILECIKEADLQAEQLQIGRFAARIATNSDLEYGLDAIRLILNRLELSARSLVKYLAALAQVQDNRRSADGQGSAE